MEEYPILSPEEIMDLILQECSAHLSREYNHEKWMELVRKVNRDKDAPYNTNLFITYLRYLRTNDYIFEITDSKGNFVNLLSPKGINFSFVKDKRQKSISKDLRLVQTWAIAIGTALSGLYCVGKFLLWFCLNIHH